jgi:uncharacterized protein (DUF849 family)
MNLRQVVASDDKRPVVLTCAVTGNAQPNPKYPKDLNFPITAKQICNAVVSAAQAGASVAHIHVRDPETGLGSWRPDLFREVVDRIRQTGVDIVLNLTAGGGCFFVPQPDDDSRMASTSDMQTIDQRVRHLEECLPELASLDATCGMQTEPGLEFIYLNSANTLRKLAQRYQRIGVKPELEAFHPGDILFIKTLIESGWVDDPPLIQIALGVKWCSPDDLDTMQYMSGLLPKHCVWAGFGIGRQQMSMVAAALLLGGNCRVGLEDNLYLERGRFATNAQLVERARQIIENMGARVATPGETRRLLNLSTPGHLGAERSGGAV